MKGRKKFRGTLRTLPYEQDHNARLMQLFEKIERPKNQSPSDLYVLAGNHHKENELVLARQTLEVLLGAENAFTPTKATQQKVSRRFKGYFERFKKSYNARKH